MYIHDLVPEEYDHWFSPSPTHACIHQMSTEPFQQARYYARLQVQNRERRQTAAT